MIIDRIFVDDGKKGQCEYIGPAIMKKNTKIIIEDIVKDETEEMEENDENDEKIY